MYGSPSTDPTPCIQCYDRQLVCWDSICQACVAVLCAMDLSEAPLSVPACRFRDMLRTPLVCCSVASDSVEGIESGVGV